MNEPLAIVSGDWHLHTWNTFNENGRRMKSQFEALMNLGYTAKLSNIPIIFTGDIGHAFGRVTLELWYEFVRFFGEWARKEYPPIWGISGNHDQEKANYDKDDASRDLWSLLCMIFPKVCVNINWLKIDTDIANNRVSIMGIPYTTYNKSFDKWVKHFQGTLDMARVNILVIHSDLYGAMDNGREVGSVEGIPKDMDEYFGGFDIVLSGHIHMPQSLGKKIYMVGAMSEQRRSDSGADFGFWTLYKTNHRVKLEFTHLKDLPKFVFLPEGSLPPDTHNYYIPAKAESKEESEVELGFSNKASKGELVRNYMKAIGDNSVSKRLALTKIINSAIDD